MRTRVILILLTIQMNLTLAQEVVWDIGTKWTYSYGSVFNNGEIRTLENEIIDTITIDNLKLYTVRATWIPFEYSIEYFHYIDGDVYSYDPEAKLLHLLYDFGETNGYSTDYIPICDPSFDMNSLDYNTYEVKIDSMTNFQMPDGSLRNVQHATAIDTFIYNNDTSLQNVSKRILDGIGFLDNGHLTHDWELGAHICDQVMYWLLDLRCFQNDSVLYNFGDIPCNSIISSTREEGLHQDIKVYPNPTYDFVRIHADSKIELFELYGPTGRLIQKGNWNGDKEFHLFHSGVNILRLYSGGKWINKRVIKLE